VRWRSGWFDFLMKLMAFVGRLDVVTESPGLTTCGDPQLGPHRHRNPEPGGDSKGATGIRFWGGPDGGAPRTPMGDESAPWEPRAGNQFRWSAKLEFRAQGHCGSCVECGQRPSWTSFPLWSPL
jgi:hypothetical protein